MHQIEKLPQFISIAAKRIWDYMNIIDDPERSDVIFILGGASLEPVKKAVELYNRKFAPKISFISQGGTFGGEKLWGMSETQKYKEVLLEKDVPSSAIICQEINNKQSRNTKDEALFAIPFLRENGINPKKVILVSRPVHQRRAYATFLQQQPDITYINCPADEVFHSDVPTIIRLIQEVDRLYEYGYKKEDIMKQVIPNDVDQSVKILRDWLGNMNAKF